MATTVLSKYFTSISGEVDGLHFSQTPYGPVLSSTPKRRPYVKTPARLLQEDRIRRASRGYKSLTKSQTLAWAQFAATTTHYTKGGTPFTPNGYQAYSALSAIWYAIPGNTGTAPSDPPTGSFSGNVPDIRITALASSGKVVFVGTGETNPGIRVECSLQSLANANRRPSKNGYKIVAYAELTAAGGNEFTVNVAPGAYAARYRFLEVSSGRRTNPIEIPVSGLALGLEMGGADESSDAAAVPKAA